AAGKSLANVIVRIAFERQRDALGEKRAEALTSRAGELYADRFVRQAAGAVASGDFATHHGADRAVHVPDRQMELGLRAMLQSIFRQFDQLVVKGIPKTVILFDQMPAADAARHLRMVKNGREIEAARLPVVRGALHFD